MINCNILDHESEKSKSSMMTHTQNLYSDLTHRSTHTPGAAGSHCCSSQGAIGGKKNKQTPTTNTFLQHLQPFLVQRLKLNGL